MANFTFKDASGNTKYAKSTGTGTNGDPFVPIVDNLGLAADGSVPMTGDLSINAGSDVFPDGSTNGLNTRFENLFGDDIPASDAIISSATFIEDDAANHKLGFTTDTTINSDSYSPTSPFSKDNGAGSLYFFARKHKLIMSARSSTHASLKWSDATAKTKINLQGAFGFMIANTAMFQELRLWGVETPGASDEYYAVRWLYDATTYPDWPWRVKMFRGTGITWSATDGTEHQDAPFDNSTLWWLRLNKPNGTYRCYLECKKYIYGDYGAGDILDINTGTGFNTGFKAMQLYTTVSFDDIILDSIEIT